MEQKESSPSTETKSTGEESPAEPEQPPPTVIRRSMRQVITTAGTIEENIDDSQIEQIAGEEVVKSTDSPVQQTQDGESTSQMTHYEEQASSEQNYEETAQQVYITEAVVTEGYSTTEYDGTHHVTYTTLEMPSNSSITIEQQQTYTDMDSVSSSQFAAQYGNDATPYIQPQHYQTTYHEYSVERTGDESPQSALFRDTDPNLASSRYQVKFLSICINFFVKVTIDYESCV